MWRFGSSFHGRACFYFQVRQFISRPTAGGLFSLLLRESRERLFMGFGNQFRSLSALISFSTISASAARYFLLLVQEKVPKEKDTPRPRPAAALRFSSLAVPFGLFPPPTAMLDGAKGVGGGNPKLPVLFNLQRNRKEPHLPVDAAEHRRDFRIRPRGAPHGRGASSAGEGPPVAGAPEIPRRREPRRGKEPGCPFLSPLSFGQAKERGSRPSRKRS